MDEPGSKPRIPIVESESVRIAMALWREGQRLTRVHDSYAFLSYFKVIELQYRQGSDRADWFARRMDLMTGDAATRVAQLRADSIDVAPTFMKAAEMPWRMHLSAVASLIPTSQLIAGGWLPTWC